MTDRPEACTRCGATPETGQKDDCPECQGIVPAKRSEAERLEPLRWRDAAWEATIGVDSKTRHAVRMALAEYDARCAALQAQVEQAEQAAIYHQRLHAQMFTELKAAQAQVEQLRKGFNEFADHQAWRCRYRSRYGKCLCGLDDFTEAHGLDTVTVDDPEAP